MKPLKAVSTPQRKVTIKGLGETTLYVGKNGWDFFVYERFGFKIARTLYVRDDSLGSEFYFDSDTSPAMMRHAIFDGRTPASGEDSPYLVSVRHWIIPAKDFSSIVKNNIVGVPSANFDDRIKTMWAYMKSTKSNAEIRVFVSNTYDLLTTGFDCLKQLRREFDAPEFPASEISAISFNYDLERYQMMHQDITKLALPYIMDIKHFASKDEWLAN